MFQVTHSLPHLRWLSLARNPITTLTNTSLLGVALRLEYLDISGLRLNTFEVSHKSYHTEHCNLTGSSSDYLNICVSDGCSGQNASPAVTDNNGLH